MAFIKATRDKAKARIAFTGPTNSGKTVSSLAMAYGIVKQGLIIKGQEPTDDQIWEKVAFIDTERERAKFYANRNDGTLPFPIGQFLHAPIHPPYTTDKYIALLIQAEEIVGEDGVVIVDSISHAWNYEGGINDLKEDVAKKVGNSYTAWNEVGRVQNKFIDTLLSLKCHTIVTMRSKMDYVLEANDKGKMVPKKVGLKPIQRDDTEYEFDITLMLDSEHEPTVIKDTTFLGAKGKTIEPITPTLGMQLIQWLDQGTDPKVFKEQRRQALIDEIQKRGKEKSSLKTLYRSIIPDKRTDDLTIEEAEKVLEEFNSITI